MTVAMADIQGLVTGATVSQTKAAVADYSLRNPVRLYAEISRNSGNDKAYDLPGDFYQLIELVETGLSGYYLAGGLMTFTVKPDDDTLHIWYAAKHTLDGSDNYPLMDEEEAYIVGLKLKAIVLKEAMADSDGLKYRQGDVEVDSGKLADSRVKQVEALTKEYLAAVKAKIGAIGVKSEYPTYQSAITY